MSEASHERLERLEMLLAEEALGQFDKHQQSELQELLELFPDFDRDSFHRAAAAMDLAFSTSNGDVLPESLKSRIAEQASSVFSSEKTSERAAVTIPNSPHANGTNGKVMSMASHVSTLEATPGRFTKDAMSSAPIASRDLGYGPKADTTGLSDHQLQLNQSSKADLWRWSGWLVAAAAIFALLVFQYRSPQDGQRLAGNSQDTPVDVVPANTELFSLEQQRKLLLEQADTESFSWTPGPTPLDAEIRGSVVWNQQLQAGFMTFEGLPINDRTLIQYQLWIIDPLRDKHPIDGGVFDITEQGFVVVPIRAKLEVIDPQAFAITIEKPGGVVVSDQSRLPLLASVN